MYLNYVKCSIISEFLWTTLYTHEDIFLLLLDFQVYQRWKLLEKIYLIDR